MDRERQSFRQRGLADAGFADKYRIVLAPAQKNVNRALELVLASDQRIDLPLRRALGEIDRVGLAPRPATACAALLVALVFTFSASILRFCYTRDLCRRRPWRRRARCS